MCMSMVVVVVVVVCVCVQVKILEKQQTNKEEKRTLTEQILCRLTCAASFFLVGSSLALSSTQREQPRWGPPSLTRGALSEWAQGQRRHMVVLAQGPCTAALGSIAAHRHLPFHHLDKLFNKVHISTLGPLALP